MNIRNFTCGIILLIAFLTSYEAAAQRIEVRVGGPRYAPSRPPCPSPDHVWVDGRWVWDNYYRRDVWVEGYWMLRQRDYYCDRDCCQRHDHRYQKRRNKHDHGRGYAYGRRY